MLRSNAAASSLANALVSNSRVGNASAFARGRVGLGTPKPAVSLGGTDDPFAAQLAQAIEGYLKSSGQSSNLNAPLQIQITPQTTNSSSTAQGSRQFIVTVTQPGATASSSTAATSVSPGLVSAAQAAAGATSADAKATSATVAAAPSVAPTPPAPTNEVDAYWATQPPAVQVLRTLSTEAERGAKAVELANQGYSIDVPIMVWGYDPLATMITRKSEGYTWTPSLGQGDPQLPPGISFPGMQSYDPTKPPAGSMKVSTDFGIGLEKTSPWAGAFGDIVLS